MLRDATAINGEIKKNRMPDETTTENNYYKHKLEENIDSMNQYE